MNHLTRWTWLIRWHNTQVYRQDLVGKFLYLGIVLVWSWFMSILQCDLRCSSWPWREREGNVYISERDSSHWLQFLSWFHDPLKKILHKGKSTPHMIRFVLGTKSILAILDSGMLILTSLVCNPKHPIKPHSWSEYHLRKLNCNKMEAINQ